MNYPRINVEETFDELVRDFPGAVVVKEKLPKSPSFHNADYVFHFEKIIAELKCLTEDNVDSPSNQLKLGKLINEWFATGKIKSKHIDESSWRDLPMELQNKIYETTTSSVRNQIKKANIQIRETKRELRLYDYSGMAILANDGIASLSPAAFIYAAQQVLAYHFSEIRYFIYLTANLFTHLREAPMPTLFWIGFDMQKGPKMDTLFTDRLGHNWRSLVCRKTGLPGFAQKLQDIEGFWKARHIT
jgi:hypothetical protein